MKQIYCDIFNLCFPQFKMSFERLSSLINIDNCTCFEHEENEEIVAFAIVEEFAIRMICVVPQYQKQWIGKSLLSKVEEHIKKRGYDKVITGGVSSRLFIGAVSDTWRFFEKNGFESVGGCDEMLMELKNYSVSDYHLHGKDIADYGWYEGDLTDIHEAVARVDESWVQYFNNPEKIYVGRVNGQIASFCLVDTNCQNYLTDAYGKVGMPGCVGTVPEYRNKGIALEMVANVTDYLKCQGMDISFIYFTGVAKWYEKIGYRTFLTEVFGVKHF